MKKFIILLVLISAGITTKAQFLVSAELVNSITSSEIFSTFGIPGVYDVDSYKVIYNTVDVLGAPTTASGLISIPQDASRVFPMMAVQHGTVDGREDVPSRLQGGYQLGLIGSSLGYLVTQADLLGLGDNPGVHPYVHGRSEATAARDLMRAAREFVDADADAHLNEQVFVTGYSQGGHGGLALHKLLEQEHNDEFTVTASSPMSGPYSISKEMVDFTLGDEEYFFCAYLVWTTMSMKAAYPDELVDYELEDVFKPEYMSDINEFVAEEIGLFELNDRLIASLRANVGKVTPKELVFPTIENVLKNDPSHPLSIALEDNDLDDWAPNAPTRLMYCSGDDQVTFRNSITADANMNALGAIDLMAVENGPTLDHGGCVTPALTATIVFFLNYRDVGTVSGLSETLAAANYLHSYQQGENLQYELDYNIYGTDTRIEIYDINGSMIKLENVNQSYGSIDLGNIPSNMYVIAVNVDGQYIEFKKMFLH
jgi:hypothetical protein